MQELVGQYSFTDKQLERFQKLHTVMRRCGQSFIVVAVATVAVIFAQVRVAVSSNAAYMKFSLKCMPIF